MSANEFLCFEGRKLSFKKGKWPHSKTRFLATPTKLAHAGFYCRPLEGSIDNVCCYFCSKNLDGWEESDEAWKEHISHTPDCPLVRLDIEANRILTFTLNELWTRTDVKSSLCPSKMASSGFFFWPTKNSLDDDTCYCFQCGLPLDGWEDGDDPFHEHSKRRPDCPFIKNRISLRPCSYEFLLANKPDENSITHFSSRSNQTVAKKEISPANKAKFAIPTAKRPAPSKRETFVANKRKTIRLDSKRNTMAPLEPCEKESLKNSPESSSKAGISSQTPQTKKSKNKKSSIDPAEKIALNPKSASIPLNTDGKVSPKTTDNFKVISIPEELKGIVSEGDLDQTVAEFLNSLKNKQISNFDQKSSKLLEKFDEAIKSME